MPFSDYKTALVTGASSGIGAAVVERLRKEGLEVHAIARSADKLKELAARMSRTVRVNLKPEATIKMIMRPLELPAMLQAVIEFPLRQFMQRVLLR